MAIMSLCRGRRGPDVERWQRFLAQQQLLEGPIDGQFGAVTDSATRAFQERNRLLADGVVGEKTLQCAHGLGFRALRRALQKEVTPPISAEARRILHAHHAEPLGSEFPFEVDGQRYYARLELHYHPPGGPQKPWGDHVGVSLFVEVTPTERVLEEPAFAEPAPLA